MRCKDDHRCDVIVTYCWNRVGYTILKSLSRKGLKVVVGDTSNTNICSKSHYVTDNFVYPDPFINEDEFIQTLKEAVAKYQPKILLPTHDEGIVIARHKDEFPGIIIPIESEELLEKLSDKDVCTHIAESIGIPCPKFIDDFEHCEYPIVVKTKIGNSAKGVYFPKSKDEVYPLMEKYGRENLLMEEFIGGSDYSVDVVRQNDFMFATVYKAIMTKTEGGGTTTQRELVDEPELAEYGKKLVKYVGYNGVIGLDFRKDDEHNRIAFIEANARYTGGLATPVKAGFDIPYIHYCLATTGKYDEPIHVKYGTKTKWILGDVITFVTRLVHMSFKKNDFSKLVSFKFDGFDDFEKGDVKAFVGEMTYYFMKLVKNGKLNP